MLDLVSCLTKGLCIQDLIGIDCCKVGCCLLKRFNFLNLIYLRNKTASLRYCVVREQRPLYMLLMFLLLLGLSLYFKLFLVLSVAIPKIDLVILASNTPPDAVLLIPHVLLIPFDHLVSEIDLGLAPFVQQVVNIGFKVVLPIQQVLELVCVCFGLQSEIQLIFVYFLLYFLANQCFDGRVR